MHLLLLLMLLKLFPRYWKLWTASNILFPIRKSPAFLLCSWVDVTIYLVFFSLWRIRRKDELEAIIKGENIVRFIKCQRIRWLEHIERMPDTAIPKKMLYGKLYATRRRGRPSMRWLDDVSMDLRKMGMNEWRGRTRNRETWRHVVVGAKTHPGL